MNGVFQEKLSPTLNWQPPLTIPGLNRKYEHNLTACPPSCIMVHGGYTLWPELSSSINC